MPLETIVILAVAIMVLVLIVLFATGAFSRLFGSQRTLEQSVTPDQVASFRIGCEQACFQAQQLSKNQDGFLASDYCKRTIPAINGVHCWDTNVSVSCSKSFVLPAGNTVECGDDVTSDSCKC